MIDLVIFDMDGTLYQFKNSGKDGAIYSTEFYAEIKRNAIEFLEKRLGKSNQEASLLWKQIFDGYNGDVSIGLEKEFGFPRKEYFESAWGRIDASEYVKRDLRLEKMLGEFEPQKAVLTNAPECWARNALKAVGVEGRFDTVWSGGGDIRKPQDAAYQQILEYYGVAAERTMMIEDEPKYLVPAKKLGMNTVLVGPRDQRLAGTVDRFAKDIYEVREIVEQMRKSEVKKCKRT